MILWSVGFCCFILSFGKCDTKVVIQKFLYSKSHISSDFLYTYSWYQLFYTMITHLCIGDIDYHWLNNRLWPKHCHDLTQCWEIIDSTPCSVISRWNSGTNIMFFIAMSTLEELYEIECVFHFCGIRTPVIVLWNTHPSYCVSPCLL